MALDTKTSDPNRSAIELRVPKAKRQGENAAWADASEAAPKAHDELVFPPISPPGSWPRIFPGL